MSCVSVSSDNRKRACKQINYLYLFLFLYYLTDGGAEVEKAPFLAKPVRLTPAWEANNLPNDELNFKGNKVFTSNLTAVTVSASI